MIDQTKLPLILEIVEYSDYRDLGQAIRELKIRGAPALGIAAAMGLVLCAFSCSTTNFNEFLAELTIAEHFLRSTRPTAVNLFWAIERMMNKARTFSNLSMEAIKEELLAEALLIAAEDEEMCRNIGRFGQEIVPEKANILTHCNAGFLATGGYGTALGVIRSAFSAGKKIQVYADETRPLLQGARLTAWELMQDKIPVKLIADNMAGYFMNSGNIDLVITGADRIAENGDTANKIGTYSLAVLAKENKIPFYIAAPSSTIDFSIGTGEEICIEERKSEEITNIGGVSIAPKGVEVCNPAFDVTPHRYISGIITEKGIVRPPFGENLRKMLRG